MCSLVILYNPFPSWKGLVEKGLSPMNEEGNFFEGIFIAFLLSIPFWIAIFGWVNMISKLLKA